MTKKEFTQKIAQGKFGLWAQAAKYALENDEIELFIEHWLEQDADPGSRPMVVRMLEGELYEALQTFKVDEKGICIKRCDKFPECEPCGSHFEKMETKVEMFGDVISEPTIGSKVWHTGWNQKDKSRYPAKVKIKEGAYERNGRISNFWYWIMPDGKVEHGYGSFRKILKP